MSPSTSRYFRQAIVVLEKLVRDHPERASFHNVLAWYLATCPDPQLRDGARAVSAAARCIELAPKVANNVNTLGVAHYRAGHWKDAVDTLEKSIALRVGGTSEDFFFLAMAHWQLDEQDIARQCYARAVEWMNQNSPYDEELTRFRAEAAGIIGEGAEKE
jgi:uncharacterized protein HemY